MSRARKTPPTRSEKSSWTPRNHVPSNEKIFEERFALIRKWYAAWSESQRWSLLEHILKQLKDDQLLFIHSLLDPAIPVLIPDYDFTRTLPRFLCLKIFSMLDPRTLCRAAQVCWYWNYLAESNEIWKEKCMRRSWFIPTPPPPLMHDYTLWKRHYIACVCQLHWNPPQLPADDPEEDQHDNTDAMATEELERSRKIKKKRTRHILSDEAKGPWRDPDPHPADIQYCYKIDSATYSPLYSRFPSLRSTAKQYGPQSTEYATHTSLVGASLASPPPPPLPPPTSILHPTLLEKMRLNSPTPAHMELTTINRQQTENEINETLYGLQDASPFPKLPPYFVHQAEEGDDAPDTSATGPSRPGSARKQPTGTKNREEGRVTNSSRPPSGRSVVSIVTPDEYSDNLTGAPQRSSRRGIPREDWLPTRAWNIPYEDD